MNRYAPPKTEVSEHVSEESAPREAPSVVKYAAWLLAASLALGLLKLIFVPVPGPLWLGLVVLAVLAAFTIAIARGANWARVIFLVFFLLGLPGVFLMREQLMQEGTLSVAVLVVQTVLQLVATVVLILPTANAWFRKPRKQAEPKALPRDG